MIAKGNLHANGAKLVGYILSAERGERVEFGGAQGFEFFSEDLREAARLMQRMADVTTKCEKAWFHTQTRLAPGEQLSPEQWEVVRTREEKRLGFTGLPCAWSFHVNEATGERHMHAAWFRVDVEQERAVDPGLYKLRLKELCRGLEKEFALREVSNHRQPHDRARVADRNEVEEARRLGTDVRAIRTAILDCFEHSDNGKAFKAALDARGLMLANGDRRDCFVVIDEAGGHHALNKKLTGQTLAETRARLADLDRTQLPGAEQAKQMQAEILAAHNRQEASREVDRAAGLEKHGAAGQGRDASVRPGEPIRDAAPENAPRPLGKTAGEIRLAWSLTNTGAQFAERLEDRGLALVYVTGEEAQASQRAHDFAKAIGQQSRALKEGWAVIDERGNVTRIDQRVTGDQWEEIQKRVGGVDRSELLSVAQAREAMHEARLQAWREEQQAAREQARPASWTERRIAECAELARSAGAVIQQDADGRRVSPAEALADRLRTEGERSTEATTVRGSEAFSARLEEVGIAIARVTETDVRALAALRQDENMARLAAGTNFETYRGSHFAELEAGDLAAVTRNGSVERINPDKLGDAARHLTGPLPGVIETRARLEIERERVAAVWEQRQADTAAAQQERADDRENRTSGAQAAREARQMATEMEAAANRGLKAAGKMFGGFGKAFSSVVSALADMFAPPPRLTAEQVRLASLAAEQRHERQAIAAEYQRGQALYEINAEEQRTREIERTLKIDPASEDERFRRIMRAARDDHRERETERDR